MQTRRPDKPVPLGCALFVLSIFFGVLSVVAFYVSFTVKAEKLKNVQIEFFKGPGGILWMAIGSLVIFLILIAIGCRSTLSHLFRKKKDRIKTDSLEM